MDSSHSRVSISESNFISVKKKCHLRLVWYSKNLQALETKSTVLQFSVNILHSENLEWAYLNESQFFPSFIICIAPCTTSIYN